MYYPLKTKRIKFKNQKVTEAQIKRALFACYANISFSTIPYLLYNYNSFQTLRLMNSGNCIAMSLFVKTFLYDNYKIISYLIPASIPKAYQDSKFLTLSHVALAVPISPTQVYICDTAFYFQKPILLTLTDGTVSEPITSVSIYDNTLDIVHSKTEYIESNTILNEYQTIPQNTFVCACYFENNPEDTWNYYIVEITNPDQSIGTTFLQTKTRPFICSTKVRDGKTVMDVYLKYITDTEIKIDHNYKNLYTGSILYIPDTVLQFINGKLYKYFKTDALNIFKRPINKKLVFE